MTTSSRSVVRDQIGRLLKTLILDKNDTPTRTKIKSLLESSVTGSIVEMYPIDTNNPTLIAGTLHHADFRNGASISFQMKAPLAAQCLICGESIEHVRVFGCVAGIQQCPYEG